MRQSSTKRSLLARAGVTTRSLARDKRGATMVEFAIVAVPFFALIFGIIEVSLTALGNYLLENATEDAARLIRTGQTDGANETALREKICTSAMLLGNCTSKLRLTARTFATFGEVSPDNPLDTEGELRGTMPFTPGGPRSIMLVTAYYEWPLFNPITGFSIGNMPNGNRLLQASFVFRNEPFPN
jgi:Flp pilus assembly protein TadG